MTLNCKTACHLRPQNWWFWCGLKWKGLLYCHIYLFYVNRHCVCPTCQMSTDIASVCLNLPNCQMSIAFDGSTHWVEFGRSQLVLYFYLTPIPPISPILTKSRFPFHVSSSAIYHILPYAHSYISPILLIFHSHVNYESYMSSAHFVRV